MNNISVALLLAIIFTLINAVKPVHVDDVIWLYFSDHISKYPLAPFSFEIPWGQICRPAIDIIFPPFMSYYMAFTTAIVGSGTYILKLSLLPINFLFSFSVIALADRFAHRISKPFVWGLVLSPAVLPAENLMQDIPAIAFVLAALALLLHACDARSTRKALLAGAILGIACLTKWSALSGFGAITLACLLFAPLRSWIVLVPGVAAATFMSWELYVFLLEGQSNFLNQLAIEADHSNRFSGLVLGSVTYIGGLAPAVAILGISGFFRRSSAGIAVAAVFVLGYLALALLPSALEVQNPLTGRLLRTDTLVFMFFGGLVWGAVALCGLMVLSRLWHVRRETGPADHTLLIFLAGWVLLELAGYFLLSPFPAARRIIGLFMAISFLAAAAIQARIGLRTAWIAAGMQIVIGALYTTVDTLEAMRVTDAVAWAKSRVDASQDRNRTWFTGEFGFEYYAAEAGFQPACTFNFETGDTYVEFGFGTQSGNHSTGNTDPRDPRLVLVDSMTFDHPTPWTTLGFGYYIGRRPLEGSTGPLAYARIYQVQ